MGIIVRPIRVLEYGAGLISTPAFLNRAVFPKLEQLISLENNREWHENVTNCVGDDPRAQLRLAEGPMRKAVATADLAAADLVFVDDSDEMGRAQTIAAISDRVRTGVPVVIHDLELWHIRRSSGGFEHVFRFDALHPQTGVAWNGRWEAARVLPIINRLIGQQSAVVSSNDLDRWVQVLSGVGKLSRIPRRKPLSVTAPWEALKMRRRRASRSVRED